MKRLLIILSGSLLISCQKKQIYTCIGWDAVNNVKIIEMKEMTKKEMEQYNKGWNVTDTTGNVLFIDPNCQ